MNTPHVTWRKEFPVAAISVPEARGWASSLLSVGGPPPFLDDVLLLLSEVVTNAITHSDSAQVAVQITRTGTTVQVEVTDAGFSSTAPVVRAPALDDDGGWGCGWWSRSPRNGDPAMTRPAGRSGSGWPIDALAFDPDATSPHNVASRRGVAATEMIRSGWCVSR
ncbi:ATP-binding protein [Nonomuraea sp. NPDC026600]|uniref:ATP-binding protein n=1 Tax=Nonomuraea sp. NPDC026600 TaxID=3155363 RepID=UPI0034096A1C